MNRFLRSLFSSIVIMVVATTAHAGPVNPPASSGSQDLDDVLTNDPTATIDIEMQDDVAVSYGTGGDVTQEFVSASNALRTSNALGSSNLYADYDDLPVVINATHPITVGSLEYGLYVNVDTADTFGATNLAAAGFFTDYSGTGSTTLTQYGIFGQALWSSSDAGDAIIGLSFNALHSGTGNITTMRAAQPAVGLLPSSSVTYTNVQLVYPTVITNSSASITNLDFFSGAITGTPTVTTAAQFRSVPFNSFTPTDGYGFYVDDDSIEFPMLFEDAGKLHFREAGTYLHSPATGYLGLYAATGIDIAGAYDLPVTDGSAGECLKTDGAGTVSFGTCGGGGGTPGGSNTQIQYNNAGSFGGISTFTTDGTNLDLSGGDLRLDDNDAIIFGTGNDDSIYHDATDLIIDPGSGLVRLGASGTDDIQLDSIGLGGTAVSSLFWVNFSQTTSVGRGALNFAYTYTGTGPTLNILSTMEYQGSSALGLNTRMVSKDGSATNNTRSLGFEHYFDTTVDYTSGSPVREFYGLRVDDADASYSSGSTLGTVRRWGLLCEELNAIAGLSTDYVACINAAEDVVIHDDIRLYLEGSRSAKGDTYLVYDSANTEVDIVVNGLAKMQIDSTDPTDFSITNLTTDRTYDANASSVAELADVLGTLINDLRTGYGIPW